LLVPSRITFQSWIMFCRNRFCRKLSRVAFAERWTASLLDQKIPAFSELVDDVSLRKTIDCLTASKAWDWESVGRIWPYLNIKWMMARAA